jgi:putative ABC transport system ATP-binding protein
MEDRLGLRPVAVVTGTAAPAVEARELYRFYRAGQEETLALRGVSLTVAAGEFVVVAGPSGSGKSTLVACLAGLDEPDGGSVRIGGEPISHRPEAERAAVRARGIGVLFQSANLLAHLSVTQNIELVQRLTGSAHRDRPRPADLLTSLGLDGLGAARPTQLSGGENARAGLAVALANNPPVLLADEPTGELDEATAASILQLLRTRARAGTAVILVSHGRGARDVADRVVELRQGVVAS